MDASGRDAVSSVGVANKPSTPEGESLLPKVVAGVTFKDGTEVIDIPADRAA